ncbi:MAG: class I SAM-dependent methyltransferase [Acidobacteriota bacterium]
MELRKLYDATDWYWDSLPYRFTYGRAYSCLAKRMMEDGRLKDSRTRCRILDCGIGTGLFSAALARASHSPLQLFGVDLSSKMLARAARRLRREETLPRLMIGDVSLPPVRTASMDCVIAALVLEHVPDPQAAICELARVAAPEAPVVLVATRPHAPDRIFRIVYRYRHYRPEELRHWMSQAGLTAVRSYNLCGIARLFAAAYIGARHS